MIELAKTLRKSSHEADPWDTTKNFWSWIRDNVKFQNGDFRGAPVRRRDITAATARR